MKLYDGQRPGKCARGEDWIDIDSGAYIVDERLRGKAIVVYPAPTSNVSIVFDVPQP